jgi:hypothetical protein
VSKGSNMYVAMAASLPSFSPFKKSKLSSVLSLVNDCYVILVGE